MRYYLNGNSFYIYALIKQYPSYQNVIFVIDALERVLDFSKLFDIILYLKIIL